LARATVFKALNELAKNGEISVVPGRGTGNPSNEYHIEGGSQNELVQTVNQFKRQTKVVHSVDKGGPRIEHKPNVLTKHKNQTRKSTSKRFEKPSLQEVQAYCQERKNSVDAQGFIDFYESKGWKIGKNPMRNWQAAIRTWERNDFQTSTPSQKQQHDEPPRRVL
jgi:hypothetical protein